MKISMAAIVAALLVLALGLLFFGGPDREFTTTSDEAYCLYEEGLTQLYAVQRERAATTFTRAVELDPDFAMAWAMRANALNYFQPDSTKSSLAVADSLAEGLPNDLERAKVQLVISGLTPGDTSADSLVAFILAEQPENLLANIAKANMLFFRREDGAAEAFHNVLKIEPNHALAYNMLGYLEAGRGDYEAALENLRKYVFMAPDLANPHDSLGEVLAWIGRYDEAEREFLTALQIQDDFHYSLVNLGKVYMYRGQLKKGLEIMEGVRSQVKGTHIERDMDQFMIQTYFAFDLFDKALAGIDDFAGRNIEHPITSYFLAYSSMMHGDTAASQAHFETFRQQMLSYGPEDEGIRDQIARLEHQFAAVRAMMASDWDTSIAEWTAMMDLLEIAAPHELWGAVWRLGQSYLAAGQPREAMEQALLILKTNPQRIRPLLLLAEAALAAGEPHYASKALQHLDKIMPHADPDLPAQATYRELKARLESNAS